MRIHPPLALLLSLVASTPLLAQGPCDFAVDPGLSSLTFSGTTDVGPIVGMPSTVPLAGTLQVALATAGNPISTGELLAGDVLVVGGISAEVPNIFPFLPPLASVDVTNLTLSAASPPFLGAANGTFATDVTVTALSGVADVVPLVGTPSTLDVSGAASEPTASAGSVSLAGTLLTLTVSFASTIVLDDPSAGITGTLELGGTLVATHDLASGCDTTLFSTPPALSLADAGAGATLYLDAGPDAAGAPYRLAMGFDARALGAGALPFGAPPELDPVGVFAPLAPLDGTLDGFAGNLNGAGRALATLALPDPVDPALAGTTLWFGFGAGPTPGLRGFTSNPTAVRLVP